MPNLKHPIPVFLPGNNRNWEKVDGVCEIDEGGKIIITLKPEAAGRMIALALNDILLQCSFDYRMNQETLDKINERYAEPVVVPKGTFIKLVERHSCQLPKTRDDGGALVAGDEWQCNEEIRASTDPRVDATVPCGKKYRWINDQREGWLWMPLRADGTSY